MQDKEIQALEQQLRESERATQFFQSDSGRIATDIATKEINKLVKKICSKDFLKDHTGYVNAVLELHARQDWLKRLQVAAAPERKKIIQEKLDQYEDE